MSDNDNSSSNVVEWHGITRLDLPPDRILENAKGKLEGVVIIGFALDGAEFFASSYADGGDVLWHLERAKKKLLELPDDGLPLASGA